MKILAIYDNQGKSFDRYSVYFDAIEKEVFNAKLYLCLAMSENPYSPLGFCQHTSGQIGRHNGKKISFEQLPIDCQKEIINHIEKD